MKISNEVRIGILAVVTVAISFWGFKFLKGQNAIGHSINLFIEYDNALRLTKSSPVSYKGVDVGTVVDIHFKPYGNTQRAVVAINLKTPINAPKNAVAVLFPDGFLGGKTIEILFDRPCSGADCAVDGDTIAGISKNMLQSMVGEPVKVKEYFDPVKNGIVQLFDTIDYKIKQPDNELGKTLRDMQSTVANLKATTAAMNRLMSASSKDIGSTFAHFNAISASLDAGNKQIRNILLNFDTTSANFKSINLNKTNESANDAIVQLHKTLLTSDTAMQQIKQITALLSSSKSSIGQLLTNDTLFTNLNMTLVQFQALSQDLRLNPKRYLNLNPFRKYKPYVLPANDPLLLRLNQVKRDSFLK